MTRNPGFAQQIKDDYTKAELSARERAIADFALKVTHRPDECSPDDIAELRAQGLRDEDILSLSEIVAYQNMSTRIMESLSTVEPSDKESAGPKESEPPSGH